MEPVVGVFASRRQAEEAVERLREKRLRRVTLLTPDESKKEVERETRTEDMEGRGVGPAIGGVVGGAVGIAGGAELAAAAASLLIPGVGPVLAIGLIGAAVLGAGGVAAGIAAGRALETSLGDGLPKDDLFLYEDALRQGRSVLIVWANDDSEAAPARDILKLAGAESLDAARDHWWMGLRAAEEEHYLVDGRDFSQDEECYRHGFEAALHADLRGKTYADALNKLRELRPGECTETAFRRGYERGLNYDRAHRNSPPN
jgi:hypothetical protein